MRLDGKKVLVTGANRGLGRELVHQFQAAGCAKVYAGVRRIESLSSTDTVQLDITNANDIAAAVVRCADIEILINNAGVAGFTPLLRTPTTDNARNEMETNYFGTLAMCRAFAPGLKRNGGGAIVNILSVVSWFNAPMQGSYCASKAAEWSLTNAVRFELREQHTFVAGLHSGYIDTDMTAGLTAEKSSPADIARQALVGIENNQAEILAYPRARTLRSELLGDFGPIDASMQKAWDDFQQRTGTGAAVHFHEVPNRSETQGVVKSIA